MRCPAREILRVFWEGEEVAGLTFYGIRTREQEDIPRFPAVKWDSLVDCRQSFLHGERWEVIVWDVKVTRWPSPGRFKEALRLTLEALLRGGCSVSWIGLEGFFVDPPDLFLPEFMSGSVLAAISEGTGLRLAVELDEPLQFLRDDELLELRQASKGLALSS